MNATPDASAGQPVIDIQRAFDGPGVPDDARLRRWAGLALADAGGTAEVTVRIVDEAESRVLNGRFRGKDSPTNVLSFGYDAPPGMEGLHGDLVICAPVVAREAVEQGKALEAHWAHMVIHGVLHLRGHTHAAEADARAMEDLERDLLGRLGYPDPYNTASAS